MSMYVVRYEENSMAYVRVNADSEVGALQKVEEMKQNGEIDSKLEVIGSSVSVIMSERMKRYA